ncbi:unnamed protein product [Callosobruchus maculatus]|uniref:Copper type II ascorbate-dependent monooxygenase C-terminal domain-containing protein n=1 Tax=Callosobruchus maculatus TaxID=64391 RepID=A0A653DH58_CALMS|nr:unnamed protein product [Callosobruchus maculatus]
MAIPPGQEQFQLSGYCTSAWTRVITRHFDSYGKELPELNRDNHYSTHFQEIRRLKKPVKVLPGHVLITRCDYNTEDRQNITLGGFSISDEMCVNYIHYFPHTELEMGRAVDFSRQRSIRQLQGDQMEQNQSSAVAGSVQRSTSQHAV